jgi:cytoskeleton protein RodZ
MAPQVGQALREARTERGIELSEIERATKIRVKFLEAMEEDRWEELPAPAYARSFLATYAEYLDLDAPALVDELKSSQAEGDRQEPIPYGVVRPGQLTGRGHGRPWKPLAILVAGLIAVVLLGVVIVGAIGGSGNGGGNERHAKGAGTGTGTTAATTSTSPSGPPSGVSVELRPTADVWVCLVDDSGRAAVNGETLTSGQDVGPFTAAAFDVTFGNGSVEMTVDGEPAKVPPLAEPLGFRITPGGVHRLDPSSQPTCQ